VAGIGYIAKRGDGFATWRHHADGALTMRQDGIPMEVMLL
jgi:hypothetical protein